MTGHDHEVRLAGIRSTGLWGAVVGVISLGAILFFLLYSYYYLDVTNEPFVPDRLPAPPVLGPALLLGALLLTLAPAASVLGGTVRREPPRIALAAAVLAAAGTAFLSAGIAVVRGQQLTPTLDAYSASVVVLLSYHGLITVVGVGIAASVAYQAMRALAHPWVLSAASVLVVWWVYVVLGWLAVGFTVYAYPQMAPGAT